MNMGTSGGNDFEDVTNRAQQTFRRRSGFTYCLLSRLFEGEFCFPFARGARCLKGSTTITLEKSKTLTGGFEYGGFTFQGSTAVREEQSFTFEWDPCSRCVPKMCYNGQQQIWDCYTNYFGFGGSKWTDTVFVPSSQGQFYLDCVKDPECCEQHPECCEKSTAMSSSSKPNATLDTNPAVSRVIKPIDFAINETSSFTTESNDRLVKIFSEGLEDLVSSDISQFSNRKFNVGFMSVFGKVNWVLQSDHTNNKPEITMLSGDSNSAIRNGMMINSDFPWLPILAVTSCNPELKAKITAKIKKPNSIEYEKIHEQFAETKTEKMTTIWDKIDLSKAPPESWGMFTIDLFDGKKNCYISSYKQQFFIRPSLTE